MTPFLSSLLVFACVFIGGMPGLYVGPMLPSQDVSSESRDVVRLVMGLVATTVALVLGLLVASAKSFYDTQNNEMTQLAANVVLLDRVLAHYGPEATDTRASLRASAEHWAEALQRAPAFGAENSSLTRFRRYLPKTTIKDP